MNEKVLCICCDPERFANWARELEDDGYVVIHANDEREASVLLNACPVDVLCIDSETVTKLGSVDVATGLKNTSRHVPVVLVQTGIGVPEHCEEHVDVVIDESTFSTVGSWLIEELREIRFPMFVEWFETWKERSSNDRAGALFVY